MLTSWENLPQEMKNDSVRYYYNILERKKGSLIIKRVFDIMISALMIVLLSWLIIIVAVLIKIDSKGPVFYRQLRVTRDNKDFRIFKFRTMVDNADKIGTLVTTENDSRITRVGAKIRKCRLDEIPQLFNILVGDMTFVGTRPEVRKYVNYYNDEMMATLLLPAGVTSIASINFKDESTIIDTLKSKGESIDDLYVNEILPQKMKYNFNYIENMSFIGDIALMYKTVRSVLK